ncbi:DUF1956 domain-containing protein [Siculibacillus lacustris]|uniref:DUF1956 domain-containing protein n=1 Tax=Siculibacillus lacustris TaxID=1549641 RepID=A0A4V2KTE1_9HYPH|nr:CerR family C-terminal domain-containing protein [Siculibacillus lacustris]TBW36928.1 DUF1956 domain-containing protein [Siculibacillus lacustris]
MTDPHDPTGAAASAADAPATTDAGVNPPASPAAAAPPVAGVDPPPPSPGEGTRGQLLRAGLDLFGRQGFDGTSIRDIARAAGANVAGIAYHFGGKTGLHRACAELIAATLGGFFALADTASDGPDEALDPDAALARFTAIGGGFARFLLARPEAEAIARFMVREQMDPSPTFTIIYEALIRPRHERMCRLWGRAVGADPASETVILTVSAILGQIMFFRVGRATALRRLAWDTIDADRVERILAVVRTTIDATAAAQRTRSRTS